MDVGTGWFHLVAFLLWLVGDYKVYLFDVADKGRLTYIRNYLQHLHDNIDLLVQELDIDRDVSLRKLEELLRMQTREEIYEACNFQDITGQRITRVIHALNGIEEKVGAIIEAFGESGDRFIPSESVTKAGNKSQDSALLHGPQLPKNAKSQKDIDALLSSLD